ncbi:MAG: RsmB/NOP family class I SAM-dependent RNA methyltransferase [Eubacteriales bacterium]|nr:RsmB/NOP family class I SAM-dependent RNA methyltransferase [Eubacteriales bacterium]
MTEMKDRIEEHSEITQRLPEEFRKNMQELLGEEYPAYIESFSQERVQGIRVNTGKISVEDFQRIAPFSMRPVPWTKNGFYVERQTEVTKHPYYYAGLYYVQEPSAMLPAARLPIQPGDHVLDLCAAPGGKATELAVHIGEEGLLVANDISHSRAMGLLKNLELFGIGRMLVCSEAPDHLRRAFGAYFDKILIDAPCSGEGMFRKDSGMLKSYEEHGPEYYAQIQSQIVEEAVQMLRPGGRMLYSTCTFSVMENEEIIAGLLEKHPELSLCEMERCDGFAKGTRGLSECIRLFPHRICGEGHFAALLQKKETSKAVQSDDGRLPNKKAGGGMALTAQAKEVWTEFASKSLHRSFAHFCMVQRDERLFAVPEGVEQLRGLRYVRTGLYLGDVKKKRFEPSQALAMYLKKQEAVSVFDMETKDPRVARYLKGETLELSETEEEGLLGWSLVCVDGYPLGWAKYVNGALRNKYYTGWRIA